MMYTPYPHYIDALGRRSCKHASPTIINTRRRIVYINKRYVLCAALAFDFIYYDLSVVVFLREDAISDRSFIGLRSFAGYFGAMTHRVSVCYVFGCGLVDLFVECVFFFWPVDV